MLLVRHAVRAHADGTFLGARPFEYSDGGGAFAGLIRGSDGAFYGTAVRGPKGIGEVFRITPTGQMTILHAFAGPDGGAPYGGVFEANDGYLYGTPPAAAFKMTAAGAVSVLHALTNAPPKLLMQGADGALYGLRPRDDETQQGSVFRLDASGAFTTLHRFNWLDGAILSGINLDPPDALMVL